MLCVAPTTRGPSRWIRVRSGALDRIAAVVIGVVLGPVIGALAWWVHCSDGPPGIIALDRTGRAGQSFRMLKLRSMRVDDTFGRGVGAALTAGEDLRVTSTGRCLRRHRLDELPQVLNVVRGEMALIGSRPEACDLVDPNDSAWTEVLTVPPGITGATQLVVHEWEERVMSGGGDHVARYRSTVLPVKLAIDRWYVGRASPGLDAVIAWSMVERFVLRRPTSAIDRLVRREVPEARLVTGPSEAGS